MTDDLKARLREDAALARSTFDFSPVHDMNSVLEKRLLRFERSLNEAADRIAELERERDDLLENAEHEAWAQNALLQLLHENGIKPGSRDLLDATKRWEGRAEAAERERDEARAKVEPLRNAVQWLIEDMDSAMNGRVPHGQWASYQAVRDALRTKAKEAGNAE